MTGGAGFVGGSVVRQLMAETDEPVTVLDAMRYAATDDVRAAYVQNPRFQFIEADLADAGAARAAVLAAQPRLILNLAAETHVDRSIDDPAVFVDANVVGTTNLLTAARAWLEVGTIDPAHFRFVQISTDEVFGALGSSGLFTEETRLDPSSPYSASKAAADLLALAWGRTYGLPVIVTQGSNTYGPYQFPEKLIPVSILRAINGRPIQIYGDGGNVRDWVHVEDHARAILSVAAHGRPGERYCIGGCGGERDNLTVIREICAALDRIRPREAGLYEAFITFVEDRPAHDRRYAIDSTKLRRETGWSPRMEFHEGLERTVRWYVDNADWWRPIAAKSDVLARMGLRDAS